MLKSDVTTNNSLNNSLNSQSGTRDQDPCLRGEEKETLNTQESSPKKYPRSATVTKNKDGVPSVTLPENRVQELFPSSPLKTSKEANNEFSKNLDNWLAEAKKGDNENRVEATRRIKSAVRDNRDSLSLEGLGLKSLPSGLNELGLKRLNLRNNKFDSFPGEISNIKGLEELNLCKNKITEFPKIDANLTKLVLLNLSENEISSFAAMEQKPSKKSCNSLTELNLSNNKIEEFPAEEWFFSSLKKLDLQDNKLTEFSETLLDKLDEVNLDRNPFPHQRKVALINKICTPSKSIDTDLSEIPQIIISKSPDFGNLDQVDGEYESDNETPNNSVKEPTGNIARTSRQHRIV